MQFLGSEFAAFKIVGSTFQLSHKIESGGNVKKLFCMQFPHCPQQNASFFEMKEL